MPNVKSAKPMKKENDKNKKQEKMKKKIKIGGVIFFNLFIGMTVTLCLLHAVNNFDTVARRQDRLAELDREYNSVRIRNEALRDKLQKSREVNKLDEEYIIGVARAHGLRKDSDIIFYLYSGE